MNRFPAALVALYLAVALPVRAAGPEDQYVAIYYLLQQGDTAQAEGKNSEAAARYADALEALQKLQRAYPTWQTNVVSFRLGYLTKRLAMPGMTLPVAPLQPTTVTPPTSAPAVIAPAADPEAVAKMNELQSQVQQLQANNSTLEAKLREALSARPASIDPSAVTQAEERLRQLAKENDLLKASLAAAPAKSGATESKQLAQLKKDLEDTKRRLDNESARTAALVREKGDLQDRLDKTNISPSDLSSRKVVQRQLDETKRKLDEQLAIADELSREKSGLAARVKALEAEAANAAALRAENALLRRQVTDLQTAAAPSASTNDPARRLVAAEAQIAALQSERDLLQLERAALETRVKTLTAAAHTKPASRTEDARRIKDLESEREVLQTKLSFAVNELAKIKGTSAGAKADELAAQLAELRAKLNVYEAKPAPYSAEELALFRQGPARLATTDQTPHTSSSIPKPPPGTGSLVVDAQRHFARGEFNQAELKYQQVLSKDSKNVYTLANLAAIQIETDKLDEAEKNLKQALAVAPDDAYSLQMLGYLKFRQEKYDDALTCLSQAAQLNPDSAEVQNYLGVTLSHKGQRNAAETALRRALVLEPGYGSAHNNLAVIYATQTPPLVELARWHYQKALAAGHPKNAELERLFNKKLIATP